MLWHKTWLETRTRFLISLVGISALCSFSVYHGDQGAMPYTKANYFLMVLQSGHLSLCTMWVLAVTLLMMGGLVREKAVGAAAFTLSLPVSRARLMGVRIAAGLLQAMALAAVPWACMFTIDALYGKAHSPGQAGWHLLLLAGGGMVFFGLALLASSLVEGEYTAPVVSFGVVVALMIAMSDPPLRPYSPLHFIVGAEYFDRHTGLLTGPVPWAHLAIHIAVGIVLMAASVWVVERREF